MAAGLASGPHGGPGEGSSGGAIGSVVAPDHHRAVPIDGTEPRPSDIDRGVPRRATRRAGRAAEAIPRRLPVATARTGARAAVDEAGTGLVGRLLRSAGADRRGVGSRAGGAGPRSERAT